MNAWMCCQELIDALGFVRRKVVGNDMDLFASRLIDYKVGQKRDELGRGMTFRGLPQHLTSLGVEGCVQRQRAMPVVLETVALGPTWRQRQHRVLAIERLDSG